MRKKDIKQGDIEVVYIDEQSVNEKITFLENEARKVREFSPVYERYFNEKLSNENFRQLSNEKATRSRYYDLVEQDIKNLNLKNFTVVKTMKKNMVSDMDEFFEEVKEIKYALKHANFFRFHFGGFAVVIDNARVEIYKMNSIVLSSEASKKAYQIQLEIINAVNKYLYHNEKHFGIGIIDNPNLLLSTEIAKYDPETKRYDYIPINFDRTQKLVKPAKSKNHGTKNPNPNS